MAGEHTQPSLPPTTQPLQVQFLCLCFPKCAWQVFPHAVGGCAVSFSVGSVRMDKLGCRRERQWLQHCGHLYTAQELLGLAQHTPGATSALSKHSSVVILMMQDKLIEKSRYFDDAKTLSRDKYTQCKETTEALYSHCKNQVEQVLSLQTTLHWTAKKISEFNSRLRMQHSVLSCLCKLPCFDTLQPGVCRGDPGTKMVTILVTKAKKSQDTEKSVGKPHW